MKATTKKTASKPLKSAPAPEVEVLEEEVVINSAPAALSEDWDTPSDVLPSDFKSMLGGVSKDRAASKPDISTLPDAMGKEGPLFVRGDKIIIERYASVLAGNPYLDTRTYLVESVDVVTGKVNLWDPAMAQFATDNWKHGVKYGYVYKFARAGVTVSSKRKRGRPRKNPTAPVVAPPPAQLGPDGKPVAKKRGRPAGVKNRPKAVIAAEKKAKAQLRAAKAAVKKKKKGKAAPKKRGATSGR